MATRVHTECPDCGVVCLPPEAVRVHVSKIAGAGARYTFDCPVCKGWWSRVGSHRAIKELLAAGADVACVPREVLEHPAPGSPALTELDVDVFLDALSSAEYPAFVASLEGAPQV